MIAALPVRPDLEYLRRQAKHLLLQAQAGEPDAVARLRAHAPGLPTALATVQLVIAREHGFASWAQLKSLVIAMASGGVRYDAIGDGYADYRRADPRIAAAVHAALGDARTVVNVGAGTGSYEPTDRPVIPIEPSTAMARQRPPALAPAVLGVAESLPLADGTVDAAMAVLTVHHWADRARGLAELVRAARRRVVLLTIDPEVEADLWLPGLPPGDPRPGPPGLPDPCAADSRARSDPGGRCPGAPRLHRRLSPSLLGPAGGGPGPCRASRHQWVRPHE